MSSSAANIPNSRHASNGQHVTAPSGRLVQPPGRREVAGGARRAFGYPGLGLSGHATGMGDLRRTDSGRGVPSRSRCTNVVIHGKESLMTVTNRQSGTNVHEVADGIYRINTPVLIFRPSRSRTFLGRARLSATGRIAQQFTAGIASQRLGPPVREADDSKIAGDLAMVLRPEGGKPSGKGLVNHPVFESRSHRAKGGGKVAR